MILSMGSESGDGFGWGDIPHPMVMIAAGSTSFKITSTP